MNETYEGYKYYVKIMLLYWDYNKTHSENIAPEGDEYYSISFFLTLATTISESLRRLKSAA